MNTEPRTRQLGKRMKKQNVFFFLHEISVASYVSVAFSLTSLRIARHL